ncbi:MAG: hypothetical protein LBL80_06490 [Ruminococcus sp.]|jgi:hypothetical protein|nr:hypothetical protein [Ruminococcus sp.]
MENQNGWVKILSIISWVFFIAFELLAVVLVVYGAAGMGSIVIGLVYFVIIGIPSALIHSFIMVFLLIAKKYLTEQKIPS